MSPARRDRKNPDLEAKLLEYRQWARTYGGYHSVSTIPKQVRTVRRYGEICDMLNPKENMEIILDELVKDSERGVKPQTLNHVIYDIEAWARFLGQPMHIPRFKQSARSEPWIPTDEEVQKIRETASRRGNRSISARNRCIIDVLFAGGLRIGELIKLNLSNLFFNVFLKILKIIHLIFPPLQMIPALSEAVLFLQFLKVSICQCSFHGLLFCLCKKKREKKIPKIVGPTRITITKMRRISIILISTPPVDPHALSVSGSRPCAS